MERWCFLCFLFGERNRAPPQIFSLNAPSVICVERWSLLAFSFGVVVRPASFTQYWMWIKWSLPEGKQVYGVGYFVGLVENKKLQLLWRKENKISYGDHLFDMLPVNVLGRASEGEGRISGGTRCWSPEVGGPEVPSARSKDGSWKHFGDHIVKDHVLGKRLKTRRSVRCGLGLCAETANLGL